jgi:hypothetical protein
MKHLCEFISESCAAAAAVLWFASAHPHRFPQISGADWFMCKPIDGGYRSVARH